MGSDSSDGIRRLADVLDVTAQGLSPDPQVVPLRRVGVTSTRDIPTVKQRWVYRTVGDELERLKPTGLTVTSCMAGHAAITYAVNKLQCHLTMYQVTRTGSVPTSHTGRRVFRHQLMWHDKLQDPTVFVDRTIRCASEWCHEGWAAATFQCLSDVPVCLVVTSTAKEMSSLRHVANRTGTDLVAVEYATKKVRTYAADE